MSQTPDLHDTASEAAPLEADGVDAHGERDRHVLKRIAAHLYERYAPVVDRATVDRVVQESYDELDRTAAVKAFLATSAGNFAGSRLRALAIARGAVESAHPRVLFIDDANAGRSQMAASLVLKHSAGGITARSAGLQPAGSIYEDALAAMDEVGITLHHAYPKPLDDDIHQAAQVIITFACADAVPQLPGKDYRDWDIPNLVGRPLEEIRRARDDIDARVRALIEELGPDARAA